MALSFRSPSTLESGHLLRVSVYSMTFVGLYLLLRSVTFANGHYVSSAFGYLVAVGLFYFPGCGICDFGFEYRRAACLGCVT